MKIALRCARHDVALADFEGDCGPYLVPEYEGDANPLIDREAKPTGAWLLDLSQMDCPVGRESDSDDDGCERYWVVLPA